ncbi:MAG: tape measure protein [Methyloversatilis sp.]|nr:tape measure protein [Methyloversatilis sp.]
MNKDVSLTLAFKTLGIRDVQTIAGDLKAVKTALDEIKGSGAAPDEVARASAAAQKRVSLLTDELRTAAARTRDLGAASAGISNAYRTLNTRGPAELRREIMGVEGALARVKASAAGPAEIARVSAIAQARLAELRGELNGVAAAGNSAGSSVAAQLAGIVTAAAAARAAVTAVQSVLQKGLEAESLKVQFDFAFSGDNARAGEELAWVRALVEELGLELESTARSYAKLAAAARGTALEGEATRDIFRAVASAATVMRLSTEQTEGALLAIQQMISKGNVQAEELRGQLGERIPGAFQIAARAIGVTTQELDGMLKKGEVIAADFLPKFAAELQRSVGGSLGTASQSLGADLNRIANRFTEFQQRIASSGLMDTIALQIDNLLARIESAAANGELDAFAQKVSDVMSDAINIIAAVTDAAITLAGALEKLAPIIAGLAVAKVAGSLGLMGSSLLSMSAAAASTGGAMALATAAVQRFLSVLGRGGALTVIGLSAEKVLELVAAMREYSAVTERVSRENQRYVSEQKSVIDANSFAKDAVRLTSEQIAQLSSSERAAYEERLKAAADYYRARSNLESRLAADSNVTPQAAVDALRESRAYEASLQELANINNRRIQQIQDFNARQAQAKDQVLATLKQKLGDQLKAYDDANKALEQARKRRIELSKANDEFIAGIGQSKPDREANTGDVQAQIARSRQSLTAGNFEDAIRAGERAKALISEIDRAGGSSADVLGYLAKQVKQLQDQAAAGAEEAQQARVAAVQETINKLRTDAEWLKTISVGFDQEGAAASMDQLVAALQAKLSVNPLVLPVVTVPQSGDAANDKRVEGLLGEAPRKATGGKLFGPGTGTSDSILLWGSRGEWMIRERAARYYGDGFMRAVNNMELPRYAMGGAIGDSTSRAVSSLSSATDRRSMQPANFHIEGIGTVPVQIERATGDALAKQLRRVALRARRS